ncbi:MAG: replicative DNA helicase [Phycisphaerales bacterium]|jgi:replicative DNA helicase
MCKKRNINSEIVANYSLSLWNQYKPYVQACISDSFAATESLILGSLILLPRHCDCVLNAVTPSHFTNQLFQRVATICYSDIRNYGEVNVQMLLNRLNDSPLCHTYEIQDNIQSIQQTVTDQVDEHLIAGAVLEMMS